MCGIAGIATFGESPVLLEELQLMCSAMYHRGPDEDGFYLSRDVGMGMRRLSIIDLESGRQPVRNEDGSVWVVFNGEIYNFCELRAELEKKGHQFRTGTDTEAIVHLYEEYGPKCVEKLRGMFVFAIWDERRRELIIARDRLGIKPLYYTRTPKRLAFASELKSILQLPDVDRSIDHTALSHLFTFLTTPGTQSIIQNVRKLPPGHLLIWAPGREPVEECYWDMKFEPDYSRTEADFVEELRCRLEEAVRLRLIADVPLGAFLSGGIDSSSVVATMSRLTSSPVKTFSIGFSEGDYSEVEYARVVAKHLGTEHRELILEPNVLDVIEDISWFLDEPFGDSSAIPTYMVSKLASEHVTVVLSGDGGDELFAGYDRYVVENRERRYRLIPAPFRKMVGLVASQIPEGMRGANFFRHAGLSGGARILDSATLFRQYQKANLFQPGVLNRMDRYDPFADKLKLLSAPGRDWLSTLQYMDTKNYLPLDILTKVDRMSMAHSIEARVPLLDHKLVEFAGRIPPEMKLKNGVTKHIFKQAMRGILPDSIIDRPKRGFAIPLGRWFRGQLSGFVRDLLLCDTSRRRGIFNPAYIEKLLQLHEQRRDLDLQLWTLISFELWARTFLDSRPKQVHHTRERTAPVMAPAA